MPSAFEPEKVEQPGELLLEGLVELDRVAAADSAACESLDRGRDEFVVARGPSGNDGSKVAGVVSSGEMVGDDRDRIGERGVGGLLLDHVRQKRGGVVRGGSDRRIVQPAILAGRIEHGSELGCDILARREVGQGQAGREAYLWVGVGERPRLMHGDR